MPSIHGTSTTRVATGGRSVQEVSTAIIALPVTAPIHLIKAEDRKVNKLVTILNDTDAAKYAGPDLDGYTARQAMAAVFDHGAGMIMMVNVFNPDTHKITIAAEAVTLTGDTGKTAHAQAYNQVVKNQAADTTYTEGTDYTWDVLTGTITRITTGGIAANAVLTVDYDYAQPSQVTSADIIGAVSAEGVRSGLKVFDTCQAVYGYMPKIWIAPGFSSTASVAAALSVAANLHDGHAYVDAPVGTSVQDVIASRSANGSNFNMSSLKTDLCYPHVLVASPSGGTRIDYTSARAAGLRAATDRDHGFWEGISNRVLQGVVGMEFPITAAELQLLNNAGICTIQNVRGQGFVFWGNRSSAFPADTSFESFSSAHRTFTLIDEMSETALEQFNDRRINGTTITAAVSTVQNFLDSLISRGALVTGSRCWFDDGKNPTGQLSDGHMKLSRKYMVYLPAEHIEVVSEADISLLSNIDLAA